jgi:hypothetical protein
MHPRWIGLATLVVSLAAASPAAAQINTDAGAKAFLTTQEATAEANGATAAQAMQDTLTPAEEQLVERDAAPGPIQSAVAGASPIVTATAVRHTKTVSGGIAQAGSQHHSRAGHRPLAHAATLHDYAATVACYRNNYVGMRLWTYKSRWTWTGSDYTQTVRAANHSEFTGDTAWFWEYLGSKYLWASGAIGTSYVGRATQGHYKATAGIGPVSVTNNDYPILDIHVHWDGRIWWSCS